MNPKYEESLRLSKEWLASHTKEELEETIKDCPKGGPTVEEYFRAVQPRGLDIKLMKKITGWGLIKKYSMSPEILSLAINGDMTLEQIEEYAQHVIQITSFTNMYHGSNSYSIGMSNAKVFDTKFDAELYCCEMQFDLEKKYKIVPVFTDVQKE